MRGASPSGVRRSMRTRCLINRLEVYQLTKTILTWLIYTKTISLNTIVRYMNPKRDRAVLEGTIKSNGILCHCCSTILTVMEFQQHAGYEDLKPYGNIFVEPGIPLLACMVISLEKAQKKSVHHVHNDVCDQFTNRGDFHCCSRCGFKYDLRCNGKKVKQDVPDASWLCHYCICKSCGKACSDKDGLIRCYQCEKCYHWKCYANSGLIDLNISFTEFCDHSCKKIYEELENKVGTKNELGDGFSWTLLRQNHQEFDILSDDEHITVSHSKLAIARTVMEECFQFTSKVTGRINFMGSYIAILEKEMACLRIHGPKLAEIPFLATIANYRKQGMCKRLMLGIETALCHLQIENLVITSTKEMVGAWVRNHAFKRIESSFEEELRHIKTLMFFNNPTRLQKTLTVNSDTEKESVDEMR